MKRKFGPLLTGMLAVIVLGAGAAAWYWFSRDAAEPGLAEGNGRIEATEIDVAAKWGGKVAEILVSEGDYVRADDVVARIWTCRPNGPRWPKPRPIWPGP